MPNRLATESSPYLRQHAENPVDWYPWGTEAFERAQAEQRPILLSVGYAACHWCHVMAHESFEDADTAALMNALFVNVKVDREERPDIDAIYMQAVQALTGQGGWPMTVVLTPDGTPYWGGTYFPKDDRHGMPSFTRVIQAVANAWREQPDAIARTTEAMRDLYANSSRTSGPTGTVNAALLERAFTEIVTRYDRTLGGFTGAPKFPQTMALDFCLRWHARGGDALALEIAHRSFVAMGRGGLFDQIGGGFARYSTDARWLVPHFEKMLYDNALLVRLGVHLWQATRDDEVRRITESTIGWLAREMTLANGGFASSLDADSEGEEGKFYVWTADEVDAVLGDDAAIARAFWRVQSGGNFEGHAILHVPVAPALVASRLGLTEAQLRTTIERASGALLAAREQRVRPALDDKVLAGWNALMTRALADAARVWRDPAVRALAVRNAELLRDRLVNAAGRVTRVLSHTDGPSVGPGFLEDHAAVALAFLSIHELTLDPAWLHQARRVSDAMRLHFFDETTGAWYDTPNDGEALITRARDLNDNATPAGPSLALEVVLRFGELDGNPATRTQSLESMAPLAEPMGKWPNAFGYLLGVAQLAIDGAVAVALIGEPDSTAIQALAAAVAEKYLPTLVLASSGGETAPAALLEGRAALDGTATAHVCRNFRCEMPVTDAATLLQQLSTPLAVT
ncbi:thioredoxin domain-containing protein [Gemmatimonas groenlandica]|uniref:Thioredoxin domain-containing protein n=1 Tax=Gemmatimonas groenlandica TaxID=2732249 RepID=A0A6M4IRE8_9BACT|nr:thioredoxin domain-containing protein [Gemmatimonas groenlandica]QJR36339.1 thioredoxin domain-containing protein [Gemmatimonas groenlandica]